MNDTFLIPSNSKRSMLILGMFTKVDLAIFITGLIFTVLLIIINNPQDLVDVGIDVLPLLTTVIMVVPVPNQHNIWTFTANVYSYLTKPRNYRWRGWCIYESEDDATSKSENGQEKK